MSKPLTHTAFLDAAAQQKELNDAKKKGPAEGGRPLSARKKEKPLIIVRPGELALMVEETQQALINHIFQRGGNIVQVIRLPEQKASGGVMRAQGTALIDPLSLDAMRLIAAKYAEWGRTDKKNSVHPCDPPRDVIQALLAGRGRWQLHTLNGICTSPVMRSDGSILANPGYDKNSCLFADFSTEDFLFQNGHKTLEDAQSSLALLYDALGEFPFKTDADRSVALAGLLTGVMRYAVPAAPMFAIDASTPGTGKSTLADLIAIVATGKPAAAMSYTPDEQEFRKQIFSTLIEGAQVILIDNVSSDLKSDALNIALTQETVKGRILGYSKTAEAPSNALWLVTGNNLAIVGDLVRRTLFCSLDADLERPAERQFHRDIYQWARENRGQLIDAALTILRAHVLAGYPGADDIKPMNSFNAWSRIVRGALVWLGVTDPIDSQRALESNDPERAALSSVFSAWHECFGEKSVLTSELLERSVTPPSEKRQRFDLALVAAVNSPRALTGRSVGKWLSRYKGRIVEGFQLVESGTYKNAITWKVIKQ